MYRFLIRTFVKDYENTKNPRVRTAYGKLAATVGIITNVILCVFKIGAGLLFNSIAVLADGVNNLTDASSSVILLVGVRLAAKPADREHPFGHERIEYITGLLISFIIILLGIQLLLSSVKKALDPDPVIFSPLTVAVLVAAIAVKIWQAVFYRKVGTAVSSSTIKATGTDSRNDVLATSSVLLSVLIGKLFDIQIDGWIGALVALFIIYSGVKLIGETSSPLLGSRVDPELVKQIELRILSHEGVKGIHDLVIHSYGPARTFASVHIEVDAQEDLIASHDMIDNIERDIADTFGIELVAHMDPLNTADPMTNELNAYLHEIIAPLRGVLGHHDLRVVAGYTHQNIIFDVVLEQDCPFCEDEIIKLLDEKIKQLSPNYFSVITVDRSFSG